MRDDNEEKEDITLITQNLSSGKAIKKLKPFNAALSTEAEEEEPPFFLEEWKLNEERAAARYGGSPEQLALLMEGIVSGKLSWEDVEPVFDKIELEILPSSVAASAPDSGLDEMPEAPDDMEDKGPPPSDPLKKKDGRKKKGKKSQLMPESARIPPMDRMGFELKFDTFANTFVRPRLAYMIENLSPIVPKPGRVKGMTIELLGHDGPWYLREVRFSFTHKAVMELAFYR